MASQEEKVTEEQEIKIKVAKSRIVNYRVINNIDKAVIDVNLPWLSVDPNVIQFMECLAAVKIEEEKLYGFSGKFYGKYGWMITEIAGITVYNKKAYWQLIIDGKPSNAGPSYHTIGLSDNKGVTSIVWKYTPFNKEEDLKKDYHPSHVLSPDHPSNKC